MSELTKAALAVAAVVALVAVVVGIVAWDSASTAERDRDRARTLERVNAVCGSRPVALKHHGPGWSMGSWWEVTCRDGSRAVVSG